MVDTINMTEPDPLKKEPMPPVRKAFLWALGFAILAVILTIVLFIVETNLSQSSGHTSISKTPLRNAIASVKTVQTGMKLKTFKGISINQMRENEPDLKWQTRPLNSTSDINTIQFVNSGDMLRLANRSDNDICYFVELHSESTTLYGSSEPNIKDLCDAKTATIEDTNQKEGWNK